MRLVLEGGGVRAAYSAGVCHGLVQAGFRCDAVVGSSSGSLNATLVASQQTETLCELWQELTPHRGLISWRRQLTPGAGQGLDIDMLLEGVLIGEGRLDLERATAGAPDLFLTATDVLRCRGRVVRPTAGDLVVWLRAALAFPAGYSLPVIVEGTRYVDGGVAVPVAFDAPELSDYAGPSVVVLTRAARRLKPPPRLYERLLVYGMVPRAAWRAVFQQHELHNDTMRRLMRAEGRGEAIVSSPPKEMPLSRFTTDEGRIRAGIQLGVEVGANLARTIRDGGLPGTS